MANSLTTRCPKCSTAFRVSDEVLSMAKGKVRCGQCFHIFDAAQAVAKSPKRPEPSVSKVQKETSSQQPPLDTASRQAQTSPQDEANLENRLAPADDIVNPDWLHTLFTDDDLQPASKQDMDNPNSKRMAKNDDTPNTAVRHKKAAQSPSSQSTDELAPWEVELAEVEAALQAGSQRPNIQPKRPSNPTRSKPLDGFDTKADALTASLNKSAQREADPFSAKTAITTTSTKAQSIQAKGNPEPSPEPDYMTALHTLAQNAAEQTRPSEAGHQHSFLEQLSAQQSLAPLLDESRPSKPVKRSHPWLWFMATLVGLGILIGQVASHYFDEGSRSSHFRGMYRMLCSYTGCTLPRFDDVSAISIQHVRIQSHPDIPNALMVNAIITNNSAFSQPMPKIALEFYDLNGKPVAARLFSPSAYLHKDFLDITFMPPNTPIHLVIPIQDPGARAVTHELKAFPAETRSY
ncbi:zinc-ribbon and DUF3426 domain-containing protein [Marinomonas posidonica]|uniref:MJ0042 family finger-like protein n=1 Tax=Marinomonas posidonica (strain CECT 7376 / NCIMB 14433 / IVIA-Po-181) TaxID=491952 RepID=F6CUL6_MARPP|nr:zinc-ribbon and DUF3426 domain-containing protein [Marinomonas posidonica]AEF54126.1 MJ0042 family finger-like protein [Marinomonas posidonica IVIA-Po-181]